MTVSQCSKGEDGQRPGEGSVADEAVLLLESRRKHNYADEISLKALPFLSSGSITLTARREKAPSLPPSIVRLPIARLHEPLC